MDGNNLKLLVAHGGTSYDASQMFAFLSWSGSSSQVARSLSVPLISALHDPRQPRVPVTIGDNVQLFEGPELLFDGYIFTIQRDSGSDTIDVSCADRGIYLKDNQGFYKFQGQTAEAITERVCRDFGVTVGNLAKTGISVHRNFPGVSLFQIIQTAYTIAAQQTGKRYMIRFRGAAMDVIEKDIRSNTLILAPGSNLLTATVSESAESLVSQVGIYDDSGRLLRVRRNEEAVAQCGVMQRVLRTAKNKDTDAEADALLEDYGIQRKITVEAMGNTALISGESVIAREPVTGLWGRYWIESDDHTWKGGLYRTKLTLNLRNLMSKAEAGKEL